MRGQLVRISTAAVLALGVVGVPAAMACGSSGGHGGQSGHRGHSYSSYSGDGGSHHGCVPSSSGSGGGVSSFALTAGGTLGTSSLGDQHGRCGGTPPPCGSGTTGTTGNPTGGTSTGGASL